MHAIGDGNQTCALMRPAVDRHPALEAHTHAAYGSSRLTRNRSAKGRDSKIEQRGRHGSPCGDTHATVVDNDVQFGGSTIARHQ
jgi:hypothetical protein